jgi:hypothetical protein
MAVMPRACPHVQPAQQPVQVGAGVAPVEGDGGLLVAALEGQQASFDLGQVGEGLCCIC